MSEIEAYRDQRKNEGDFSGKGMCSHKHPGMIICKDCRDYFEQPEDFIRSNYWRCAQCTIDFENRIALIENRIHSDPEYIQFMESLRK